MWHPLLGMPHPLLMFNKTSCNFVKRPKPFNKDKLGNKVASYCRDLSIVGVTAYGYASEWHVALRRGDFILFD